MTSAKMQSNPSRMMWNSNLGIPATDNDPNSYMLFEPGTLKQYEDMVRNVIGAKWQDYLPGNRYYNIGASGIKYDNYDRLPGFIMNKRSRTPIYTGQR